MILKIGIFLSNRASYYRHKILLQSMLRDKRIAPFIFLTSSLLDDEYQNTHDEIHGLFDAMDFSRLKKVVDYRDMAYNSGVIARDMYRALMRIRFDAIVLIADRWELLPAANIAAYMNRTIIHIQGGEDTENIDQKVRHSVSMLSDLHLVSHKYAARRLTHMGLKNIHITGCPSLDLITALEIKYEPQNNVICIFHPHTKEAGIAREQTESVKQSVLKFCEDNNCNLYWFAPNNDPGNFDVKGATIDINVIYNMFGEDFLKLLSSAKLVVGNSSCAIRECSFLGIPAVTVGDRQGKRIRANNVVSSEFDNLLFNMNRAVLSKPKPSDLFGDGNCSEKIIKIMEDFLWEKRKESRRKEQERKMRLKNQVS